MPTEDKVPEYSVVVPVYQSAESVAELVSRLTKVFDKTLAQSFEILLVDDGSDMPQTWPTLTELAQADARVHAIRLMRNYGKPAAVLCGLTHARGHWAITIDDDLQQRPEDIEAMVAHREHDVVIAAYASKMHAPLLNLASRIKAVIDATVLGLPLRMTPLKLIRRETVDLMLRMRAGRPYIPALLAQVTTDFKAVPLDHQPGHAGPSRYNFWRRLRQFSNLVISHSGIFARLWAIAGLACLAAGMVTLLALVIAWAAMPSAPVLGLATLAAVFVVGGMILLALGVAGEYLIRLVELTSHRPPFLVREIYSTAEDPPCRRNGDD